MAPNNSSSLTLGWYDYVIFSGTLIVSTSIGIYYGCFGSRQSTTKEYLMGGKTMKILPIAVSVAVSHISGTLLLATVADVFRYGASVWLLVAAFTVMGFLAIFVYLPVFFKLQVTNIYEYLEKRFDKKTRMLALVFYLLSEILMFPVYAYTPSLTLATASGVNVNLIAFILCVICIFYTSIGGFKTVVWTDFLQFGVIMASLLSVYILGLRTSGGFVSVWNTSLAGERLQVFNFAVDLTARDSFWGYVLGSGAVSTAAVIVHQTGAQKFLTLSKYTDCKWSAVYTVISMCLVHTFCVFIGLLVYAKYKDCDPLTAHMVSKHDQIFPYFVTEIGTTFPGVSGLFIAAICSASLSSMSSNLNALSGVLYKDVISLILKRKPSDLHKSDSGVLKIIVLVVGILCTCLVFAVERLGEVLSISLLVTGLTQGPLLGAFTLGVLFPKADHKGAFYGMIGGFIAISCLALPARYYQMKGLIKYPTKPLSTSECALLNQTLASADYVFLNSTAVYQTNSVQPYSIFKVTFFYYTLLGAIVTIIIGLIISYMSKSDSVVHEDLLSPILYKCLSRKHQGRGKVLYTSVQDAVKISD